MPDENASIAGGASSTEPAASTIAAAPAPAADPAAAPGQAPAAAPAAPAASPAPAQNPNDPAKPAGDPAKAAEPAGAPEAYEPFTLPNGMALDEKLAGDFTGVAKELNLTQAQAQKLVDLQAKGQQTQIDAHQAQVQGWRDAVMADKEIGGDKLTETSATVRRAIDLAPPEVASEVRDLLNTTGFGNHPAVVKLFHAIGKQVTPDGYIQGSAPKPAPSMFPNSNMAR